MGLGVQSGWADPTNPAWSPGGSDFLKIFNDIKRVAVRPSGRWLRYDTLLYPDKNWYNCRVYLSQYDVDAETGQMVGPIGSVADTFTINTTGIYALACRERFLGGVNGNHGLRITISGGSILAESDVPVVPLHLTSNYVHTFFYLTAGQQIIFQHMYDGYGDSNNLTLYTNIPGPEISIHMLAERDLHS